MVYVDLTSWSVDDLAGDCLTWHECAKYSLWSAVHDDVDILGGVVAHFGWGDLGPSEAHGDVRCLYSYRAVCVMSHTRAIPEHGSKDFLGTA